MKNKQMKQTGIIMAVRKAEGGFADADEPKESENYGLEHCAKSILAAIDAKDASQLAKALKDAFDVLESQPHEEAEHGEDGDTE